MLSHARRAFQGVSSQRELWAVQNGTGWLAEPHCWRGSGSSHTYRGADLVWSPTRGGSLSLARLRRARGQPGGLAGV